MAETIIGGEAEKKILKEMLRSKEAELIALPGRRRVGKTFLIRNCYQQYLVFVVLFDEFPYLKNWNSPVSSRNTFPLKKLPGTVFINSESNTHYSI